MLPPLTVDLIDAHTARRPGTLIAGGRVLFLVAHDTGNPGSTARNNVDYYKRTAKEMAASAHLFVDDVALIECVPSGLGELPPEKAWHVRYDVPGDDKLFGAQSNDVAVGVELCTGGKIEAAAAVENYVDVLIELCKRYKLDPRVDIVTHKFLDPARRTDPESGLARCGTSWAEVRERVIAGVLSSVGLAEPAVIGEARTRFALNLREAPNTTAKVLRVIPAQSKIITDLCVIGRKVEGCDRWYRVVRAGEKAGYVWGGGLQAIVLPPLK